MVLILVGQKYQTATIHQEQIKVIKESYNLYTLYRIEKHMLKSKRRRIYIGKAICLEITVNLAFFKLKINRIDFKSLFLNSMNRSQLLILKFLKFLNNKTYNVKK